MKINKSKTQNPILFHHKNHGIEYIIFHRYFQNIYCYYENIEDETERRDEILIEKYNKDLHQNKEYFENIIHVIRHKVNQKRTENEA